MAKKLLPQIKKVGVIYNTSEQNSQIQVEQVKEEGKKLGLEVVEAGITNVTDMAIGLDTLLPKVDILYTPTDNLVVSATPLVLEKANKAGKPVIGSVEDQVAQGALVTQGIDYEKLGYQTGEIAIRVLNGEKPNSIAIETLKETTLIINKKAAEKYNINMSNEILKFKYSMILIKVSSLCLYALGILFEAESYHLRYVLPHVYPFMQLFKIGFLCFYMLDLLTIVFFISHLFMIKENLKKRAIESQQ